MVEGAELAAEQARCCAHRLLDDPAALCDPGDQLEGGIPSGVCLCAGASSQESVVETVQSKEVRSEV